MAHIVWTDDRENLPQDGARGYHTYNGLDCCVTMEVFNVIEPQLDEISNGVYLFEKKLYMPVLDMNGKGILVDRVKRDEMVQSLRKQERKLDAILQRFAHAVWDGPLSHSSPHALHKFFYGAMGLSEQKVMSQGRWRVSTNREALEKLTIYIKARPIINTILALRDVTKQIQTLTTGIDRDGRLRTSYNVAGTETGRWSSSENAFGTGGNLQNITEILRAVFVADKGKKLAYLDLEQAESRAVGLLAFLALGKDNYLRACESGDLHTVVAKLCWPKLAWPGTQKEDRALAEEIFYRQFSRRDLAKRGGHGTNYYGKHRTIAKNLQIEEQVAEEFQAAYFEAFPEIKDWHKWVAQQLLENGYLTTPLGRRRYFFDRLDDDSTLRKAIAYVPQSMIADMVNESLFQIWHQLGPQGVEVLLQVHDAVVVQYPEDQEEILLPKIKKLMRKDYVFEGRPFSIGSDAQVGWNWGKHVSQQDVEKAAARGKVIKPNLDGLMKIKGADTRKRTQQPNVLDGEGLDMIRNYLENKILY